jgi:hypothetical protein
MIPFGRRVAYAFRAFFSILTHGRIADDVAAGIGRVPDPAPAVVRATPPDPVDRATQMLALLQRDGRLLDFLMEDLAAYPDAQVGGAVRDVHGGSRLALDRYVSLAPVMHEEEGQTVSVDRGADAARIKIVGNVAGQPPYKGVLRHRGWEATRVELPPLPTSGRSIVAPAEVEVP